MSQQYTTADLTSVLATLSALSNQQPQPYSQNTPGPEPEDNDTYEPSETIIPINPHLTPTPASQPKPHSQPQPQPPKPNPERPNTSTITAWPPALKSVMRTVSQNEDLQRKIRWLIQRQHDHEKQWWEGREALVKKQKARGEKKKELDAVL
ncbi:hypothetical protein BDV28DRAFT_141628 [Aspergillus coremiiformis]|uniref:Uncharacterized protein n=1 Tax=Aspergillus coremiiformis TaxID=138285 RepID=A0A5N6YZW6_9EURO|nr:hypothetical protein BDV28DRAFT_141628 [Aspergillus coremiiformis]